MQIPLGFLTNKLIHHQQYTREGHEVPVKILSARGVTEVGCWVEGRGGSTLVLVLYPLRLVSSGKTLFPSSFLSFSLFFSILLSFPSSFFFHSLSSFLPFLSLLSSFFSLLFTALHFSWWEGSMIFPLGSFRGELEFNYIVH